MVVLDECIRGKELLNEGIDPRSNIDDRRLSGES